MSIVSLQSSVAYGHVGNAAAVFALRRLGVDVWPIDTVRFSNHPGHGGFRGRRTSPREAAALVRGLAEAGVLAAATGVLSGYLGQAAMGRVLADLIARVRRANPAARVCLDPVMGDHGRGLYVDDGLVDFFRDRGPALADILTPNHFELELLVGRPLPDLAAVVAAARQLGGRGPPLVVVSSVATDARAALATIAVTADGGAWQVVTPRLDHAARGAGDLLAALLLAHRLAGRPVADALAAAVASVFAVIAATVAGGGRELALVAAQAALVRPTTLFPATAIG